MLAVLLKALHVLGVVLFLGAGLSSAFTKLHADRTGDVRVIAWAHRAVVDADKLFTFPSAVLVPVTGLWLADVYGTPWSTPWIWQPIVGFVVMGLLWLPAFWLQRRMRDAAEACVRSGEPLPASFHRDTRTWFWLGVPAFVLAVGTVWIMVSKRGIGG